MVVSLVLFVFLVSIDFKSTFVVRSKVCLNV